MTEDLNFTGQLKNASRELIEILATDIESGRCGELDYKFRIWQDGDLDMVVVDGEACRKSKE